MKPTKDQAALVLFNALKALHHECEAQQGPELRDDKTWGPLMLASVAALSMARRAGIAPKKPKLPPALPRGWSYHEPQKVFPRHLRGCDFGVVGRVLVEGRHGTRFLVVRAGYMAWAGNYSEREYQPAAVMLYDMNGSNMGNDIAEGGRWSKKRAADLRVKIDDFFGKQVAHLIAPNKTLVIP